MSLEIRDSSTPLRSARNDKAAGGSASRGAENAMNTRNSLNRYKVTLGLPIQRFNDSTI